MRVAAYQRVLQEIMLNPDMSVQQERALAAAIELSQIRARKQRVKEFKSRLLTAQKDNARLLQRVQELESQLSVTKVRLQELENAHQFTKYTRDLEHFSDSGGGKAATR
jgi:hypothetical protein